MSYRFTNSDKWTDGWFSDLSPNGKLLFIFLYENCDNAGFYEVNKKFMLFLLGFNETELKDAIKELGKCYVKSKDGTIVWLKNFLKHQKKTPLNFANNSHKQVILLIQDNLSQKDKFKDCKELTELVPIKEVIKEVVKQKPVVIDKKPRVNKKFEKPSEEDILIFMNEKEFAPSKVESHRFWNWFESNGWKVGKNPMKNWKGAVNTWIVNWYDRNNIVRKNDKITNVKESHEKLEGIDWNKVYESKEN